MKKELYSALAFAIIAYVLLMMHSELLFALQDNSIFIGGHTFMQEMLNRNQGLWIWVGCYLTQFFYYPWLGAMFLVSIWFATHIGLAYAFKAKGWMSIVALLPVVFELFAVMTFGYYIYYAKCPGYAFAMATCIMSFAVIAALARLIFDRLHKGHGIIFNIALALCAIVFVVCNPIIKIYTWQLPSKTFFQELKMYRAIDECRWDDVISENEESESPTNLMVLYKDIALIHSNNQENWFRTNNCGTLYDAPDSLQVRISIISSPMIFYQFGEINTAYRWAMENSVEYGMTVKHLKMLIRTAIFNQEFDLAQKYISILKATKFHKDWAIERERQIYSSTLLIQSEEFQKIAPLVHDSKETFINGSSLCEESIIELLSSVEKPATKKLEMAALNFSLVAKDGFKFSYHLVDYIQHYPHEKLPNVFQEGAILFGSMEELPLDISNYEFDEIVSSQYNDFITQFYSLKAQGKSNEEMGEILKPLFGRTYWWHYYFYTDFTIY